MTDELNMIMDVMEKILHRLNDTEKRFHDIEKRFQSTTPAKAAIAGARWLNLRKAALYSGIGKQKLIRLAKDGIIRGTQDSDNGRGDWIFDALSIDAYREGQMNTPTMREKALAILRGNRL